MTADSRHPQAHPRLSVRPRRARAGALPRQRLQPVRAPLRGTIGTATLDQQRRPGRVALPLAPRWLGRARATSAQAPSRSTKRSSASVTIHISWTCARPTVEPLQSIDAKQECRSLETTVRLRKYMKNISNRTQSIKSNIHVDEWGHEMKSYIISCEAKTASTTEHLNQKTIRHKDFTILWRDKPGKSLSWGDYRIARGGC